MKKQITGCHRLESLGAGRGLFLLCWLIYFTSYIGRFNYSVAMAAMLEEGVFSLEAAGSVSTAYFLCYGVGQLINGLAGSRKSPFRLILVGITAAGFANIVMGLMEHTMGLVVVWGLNGFFQSMLWPPIIRIFAEILPELQQSKACVNIISSTPAGTLVSYMISAVALSTLGWQWAFFSSGVVMLLVAAVWYAGTRRLQLQCCYPRPVDPASLAPRGVVGQWGPILRQLAAVGLLLLILPVAIHGTIKDGVTAWVPTFIQGSFSTGASLAAVVTMALPVVNLVGPFLAGFTNDRWIHNEIKTCILFFGISTLSLALLPLALRWSLAATMVLLAITTSAMLGINAMLIGVLPVRLGKKGNAAAFSGLLNATTYFGAAGASWGIGLVAARWGWNVTILLWTALSLLALLFCLAPAKRWGAVESTLS